MFLSWISLICENPLALLFFCLDSQSCHLVNSLQEFLIFYREKKNKKFRWTLSTWLDLIIWYWYNSFIVKENRDRLLDHRHIMHLICIRKHEYKGGLIEPGPKTVGLDFANQSCCSTNSFIFDFLSLAK